jgi:hypothetical protein
MLRPGQIPAIFGPHAKWVGDRTAGGKAERQPGQSGLCGLRMHGRREQGSGRHGQELPAFDPVLLRVHIRAL